MVLTVALSVLASCGGAPTTAPDPAATEVTRPMSERTIPPGGGDPAATEVTRPMSERTIPPSSVVPGPGAPVADPGHPGAARQTEAVAWSPLAIESIGFDLQPFDPATGSFGALRFTRRVPFDLIFADFGAPDVRTADPTRRNPQPVFVLPVGTPVLSLVDGIVVHVERLYSGDFTIMVAESERSTYRYETEHVENVTVNVGDRVTGGQPIATVSRYNEQATPGFGVLEIGILHPEGPTVTQHLCPFAVVDPAFRPLLYSAITRLYEEWERYLGRDVYPEPSSVPGCRTTEPVAG